MRTKTPKEELSIAEYNAVEFLAGHWPGPESHQRHAAFAALAGGLLRGGMKEPRAELFVEFLAEQTGDEEAIKRVALVRDTAAKLRKGTPVTGWPKLAELLGNGGAQVVKELHGRLRLRREVSAVYTYLDEAGCYLFEVVRYVPKAFSQRRRDGKGGYIDDLKGVRRTLYRLPQLIASDPAQPVFVCEGEKDTDNVAGLELTATTNPGGADQWRGEYASILRDRHVVLLPHNDQRGREHMAKVLATLKGVARSVKVLELPGLADAGDVSDWLQSGHTKEELLRLAAAAPVQGDAAAPPVFTAPMRPLTVNLLPVPDLAPKLLPDRFRTWLMDIATRGCFPMEFPAAAAIVQFGSLIGRQLGIRPKRRDSWLVVPNLWGAVVGPPSVQKTPGVAEAMLPMKRLVAEAIADHEQKMQAFRLKDAVAKAKAKAARKSLEKAAQKAAANLEELAQGCLEGDKEKEPPEKRYLINDSTVEKLGEILADNTNGVLTFRDEITGFLRTLDREGHENDRGFYLEAWDGLGSYTYDRIQRGTIHMPAVCVSLFGTIQPGPLSRYVRSSLTDADGLLARFQLLVYPDPPESWENVDRYPDSKAKNDVFKLAKVLAELNTQDCEMDEDRDIPYLRFAPAAQDLFDEWRHDLENRLRSGGHTPLMQEHLGKYRSLMPSLALIFHLIEVADKGDSLPSVTLEATARAAAWCDLLETHAQRVYRAALDGDPEAGQRLAEHLKKDLPNPFKVRDVWKKGWAGLTTPADVEQALGVLEDRGWVLSQDLPAGPAGGRPTTQYWIHPDLLEGRS
jgi:putative DNA primase/helicase